MSGLPPLTTLDDGLLQQHELAHERLGRAVSSADPAVRAVWWHLVRRLLLEGLANLQPVFGDVDGPLLLPPPRRFLDDVARQRLAGAGAALRHIDSALTMATMPGGHPVVQPALPRVLNALLSGPVTERETNAGLVRVTPTNWMPDANSFEHPPPAEAGELLDAAVALAGQGSGSAVERAGWLAFVTMTVHPFVDGNGRTARAMFLAVAGAEVPGDIDWGVLDQWHLARKEYLRALQAGQRADRYDPDAVDPEPFVRFAAIASARGADVGLARLELLAAAASSASELRDATVLRVIVDRFVSIDDVLADSADDPVTTLGHVDDLVARGVLAVAHAGPGSPRESLGGRGVVIGEALAAAARDLRHARHHVG